jgi:hypothetical protein
MISNANAAILSWLMMENLVMLFIYLSICIFNQNAFHAAQHTWRRHK